MSWYFGSFGAKYSKLSGQLELTMSWGFDSFGFEVDLNVYLE